MRNTKENLGVVGMNKERKFLEKLKRHNGKTTILTGAGVSTPSGIPDFRSPNGIYSKYEPELLFGIDNLLKNPSYFYTFAVKYLFTMEKAKPNATHFMLAKLEKLNLTNGVITQNIDMLHEKAGSKNVAEVHGSIKIGHCLSCNRKFTLSEMEERALRSSDNVARCDCGGIIKPDIVFFGEPLPKTEVEKSYRWLEDSTLVVAMGTSLAIYPVGAFPKIVLDNGGELVIVNSGSTSLDSLASEIYNESLENFSKEVLSLFNSKGESKL